MGLFSHSSGYLGVDIGTSSIKIAELANDKGRAKLLTYGYSNELLDVKRSSGVEVKEKAIRILKEVCSKANVSTTKTIASLPSFSVFSSVISVPDIPKKDLTSAIRWEAKKVIPLPIEEMVLYWKVLEEKKEKWDLQKLTKGIGKKDQKIKEGEKRSKQRTKISAKAKKDNIKILITGAPKSLVKRYMDIFKGADLNLLVLETETFALMRSLVGRDQSTIMLVNFGALTTDISILSESIPYFNRSIDIGGSTLSKAIANNLNVSLSRAEQFKRDIGMSSSSGQGDIPKTIESVLSPIINEIKYSLNLYHNQSDKRVEKIILSGGSAMLGSLTNYLTNVLNIKTYIGDPWARVIYPEDLKPVLDEIGSSMSVAIGLAMREIE